MVDYLLSVSGFYVLTLAALGWLAVRPRAGARRWLIALVLVFSAASIRVFPWVLSRPLLFGYHPFTAGDVPGNRTAVVVLGAGSFTVHGVAQRIGVIDLAGAARVLEAARVYRLLGSPWIISSGGAAAGNQTTPSSETMRTAMIQLGVPADRIVLESESLDTHDEAVLVAPMLKALDVDRVVVVTSDVHMRRSMATFRAAGIEAIPAIAPDPLNFESRVKSFVPTIEGLRFTSSVVHEYVGLVYYRLRGWIRFAS